MTLNIAISQRKIHSVKSFWLKCSRIISKPPGTPNYSVIKLSRVWLWITHLTTPSLNYDNQEGTLLIFPLLLIEQTITDNCHVAWTEHNTKLLYSKILQGHRFRVTPKIWLLVLIYTFQASYVVVISSMLDLSQGNDWVLFCFYIWPLTKTVQPTLKRNRVSERKLRKCGTL